MSRSKEGRVFETSDLQPGWTEVVGNLGPTSCLGWPHGSGVLSWRVCMNSSSVPMLNWTVGPSRCPRALLSVGKPCSPDSRRMKHEIGREKRKSTRWGGGVVPLLRF